MCFVAFGWSSRIETIQTESGIEVPEYRERISKIEIDDRAIPHNWKNRNKTNFIWRMKLSKMLIGQTFTLYKPKEKSEVFLCVVFL